MVPSGRLGHRARKGFSLVELLTVMAIIGLLTTLSVTGLASLMVSNHLNEATAIMQGQLELARQTAKTLNRPVQLRLYQEQSNSSIDCLQIVVPAENPAVEIDQPIEKPTLLPQSVIIADSTGSTGDLALKPFPRTSSQFNPAPPSNYTSCYFLTFSPTGAISSSDPSGAPIYPSASNGNVYWSLALVPQGPYRALGNSVGALKDSATFYLNSVNGTYSCARP